MALSLNVPVVVMDREAGNPLWFLCGRSLMGILVLYGSRYVGLYNSESPGLYGSAALGLMVVGQELVGDRRSALASRLFRTAGHVSEDSISRQDGS